MPAVKSARAKRGLSPRSQAAAQESTGKQTLPTPNWSIDLVELLPMRLAHWDENRSPSARNSPVAVGLGRRSAGPRRLAHVKKSQISVPPIVPISLAVFLLLASLLLPIVYESSLYASPKLTVVHFVGWPNRLGRYSRQFRFTREGTGRVWSCSLCRGALVLRPQF